MSGLLNEAERRELDQLLWWSSHYQQGRQYELAREIHADIDALFERAKARHAAIADTHAQRGDAQQAPSLMSGGGAGTAIAQGEAA